MVSPLPLNPQQHTAATEIEGPMMVLAGPGTGKTQILAARIEEILKRSQLGPHNILCLTFTESGVVAMRERLLQRIGAPAYAVKIHTFHSFCQDIIRENPEIFFFLRSTEPLSDLERFQLIRGLLDQRPASSPIRSFSAPYFYERDLQTAIRQLKLEAIDPPSFHEHLKKLQTFLKEKGEAIEAFTSINGNQLKESDLEAISPVLQDSPLKNFLNEWPQDKKERTAWKSQVKEAYEKLKKDLPKQFEVAFCYEAYNQELSQSGRYDFEDMILFVIRELKQSPLLLSRYQERYQYLLVDEYQDTNGSQNLLVELLSAYFDAPNLFVVGDDKQSIYRFQGASLENILHFHRLYSANMKRVVLKENYRSQQTILDAAQSLIQHNTHSLASLHPELMEPLHAATNAQAEPLQIAELNSPLEENFFIAQEIQKRLAAGTPASEIAVLYRNHRDAEELISLLGKLNIPFKLEAGKNILEDLELRAFLRFFRVIQDPLDQENLFFTLQNPILNLPRLEVLKLTQEARSHKKNLFEQMAASPALAHAATLFLSWGSFHSTHSLPELFEVVLRESGYLKFISEGEEKIQKLSRINSLFSELKQLCSNRRNLTLKDWLTELDLLVEAELPIKEKELTNTRDAVRLMSSHKSKGLEFEQVFIMQCVDKHWGNARPKNTLSLPTGLLKDDPTLNLKERNEDDRRLFYVSMTRAKKHLTLTYSNTTAAGRPQVPSQFLQEIETQFTQKADTSQVREALASHLEVLFAETPKPDPSEEEKAFVRGLLQDYVLNVSHLNNYLKCPRLFYYQSLLKVPSAKNKWAALGTAVHGALYDFILTHRKTDFKPTKEELLQSLRKHLVKAALSKQDFELALHLGEESLSLYFDQVLSEFIPYSIPEKDFKPFQVRVEGVPITGRLDLIRLLDESDQSIEVIDYKTGDPESKKDRLEPGGEYHRQIVFYKLLCDNAQGFNYKMTRGAIEFIQPTKAGQIKKVLFDITKEQAEDLIHTIKAVYEDILNLAFLDPNAPSCGECDYCNLFK